MVHSNLYLRIKTRLIGRNLVCGLPFITIVAIVIIIVIVNVAMNALLCNEKNALLTDLLGSL